MSRNEKIGLVVIGIFLVGVFAALVKVESPSPSLSAVYGSSAYVTTSTSVSATTTLYNFAGVLHTISITKPVSNSVITIYDSATTTASVAPIVITIPSSSVQVPFTLLIDGIFNNGLTIQQTTATSTVNVSYQQN